MTGPVRLHLSLNERFQLDDGIRHDAVYRKCPILGELSGQGRRIQHGNGKPTMWALDACH
jgi:hypothetical protein